MRDPAAHCGDPGGGELRPSGRDREYQRLHGRALVVLMGSDWWPYPLAAVAADSSCLSNGRAYPAAAVAADRPMRSAAWVKLHQSDRVLHQAA